jgi:hypothetical protein
VVMQMTNSITPACRFRCAPTTPYLIEITSVVSEMRIYGQAWPPYYAFMLCTMWKYHMKRLRLKHEKLLFYLLSFIDASLGHSFCGKNMD